MPEIRGCLAGLLFEEMVEMGRRLKAQRIAYLRDIPVCVFQQRPGFGHQSFRDHIGSGLTGGFLHRAVQVVHVHG